MMNVHRVQVSTSNDTEVALVIYDGKMMRVLEMEALTVELEIDPSIEEKELVIRVRQPDGTPMTFNETRCDADES